MARKEKAYQRSVRLSEDLGQSLEKISNATDLSVNALISMASKALVEAYEIQGGQITLPLKFRAVTLAEYLEWKEKHPSSHDTEEGEDKATA